jgi:hypothetical protein
MRYLPLIVIFLLGVVLAARVRGIAPFIPSL